MTNDKITNAEKYKTARERTKAFREYCNSYEDCDGCVCYGRQDADCSFIWLEAEAKKEALRCPFCGETLREPEVIIDGSVFRCFKCGFTSPKFSIETRQAVVDFIELKSAEMAADGENIANGWGIRM